MAQRSTDHGSFKNFVVRTASLTAALEALLEEKQPTVWSSAWLIKTDRRLADGLRARFSYSPDKATEVRPYLLTQIDPKWHSSYVFGKSERWVEIRVSQNRPEQRARCITDLVAVLTSSGPPAWNPNWLQEKHTNLYARISRNFDCPFRGVAWDEVLSELPREMAKRFRILHVGGGKSRAIPAELEPPSPRIPSQQSKFHPKEEYDDPCCKEIHAEMRKANLYVFREVLTRQDYYADSMYDRFIDLLHQAAQKGNRTARQLLVEFVIKYARDVGNQGITGMLGRIVGYSNNVPHFTEKLAEMCSYLCPPNESFFPYFLRVRTRIASDFLKDRSKHPSRTSNWIEAISEDRFYCEEGGRF